MNTEIGLVPLFPSTIETMSRSVLLKHAVVKGTPLNTMQECISVSLAVLFTVVKKHRGAILQEYTCLSQLMHCFEY